MAEVSFYDENGDGILGNPYNCPVPRVNDCVVFRNVKGKSVRYRVEEVYQILYQFNPRSGGHFEVYIKNTSSFEKASLEEK